MHTPYGHTHSYINWGGGQKQTWVDAYYWQGPNCLGCMGTGKVFPGSGPGNWQSLPLFRVWMLTEWTESIDRSFLLLHVGSLRLLPYSGLPWRGANPCSWVVLKELSLPVVAHWWVDLVHPIPDFLCTWSIFCQSSIALVRFPNPSHAGCSYKYMGAGKQTYHTQEHTDIQLTHWPTHVPGRY